MTTKAGTDIPIEAITLGAEGMENKQGSNVKKKKKKKGFLFVFVLIWVLLIVGTHTVKAVKQFIRERGLSGGFDIVSEKEYKETWKNTMSDIEGLTLWDKYKKGLAVSDGSDTDGDGLTDKEEIEQYHSDPLKISTAGDLYTDSYKVANNMDVKKRYDYEGDIRFPNNTCEEVSLQAKTPTDLNAVVKRVSESSKIKGCEIYSAYEVYNYSGKLTIDISDVCKKKGIEAKAVSVFVSDGDETVSCNRSVKGSSIIIKKKLKPDYQYKIYICEKSKEGLAQKLFGGTAAYKEDEITGEALILDVPILTYLVNRPVVIYYEDLGNKEKNEILKNKIIAQIGDEILEDVDNFYSEEQIKKAPAVGIKAMYELLKNVIPFFDITEKTDDEISFINLIFFYYSYEDRNAYLAGKQRDDEEDVKGFAVNELPFANFKSYIGEEGNCAGITHLTAYLYNNRRYPSSGTYTQDGQNISWNLTADQENATLMDPGLYDYKSKSFVADYFMGNRYLDVDKLSEGEVEFVKMIGSAYLAGNKEANRIYQYSYGGVNGNHIYDYALINEMKRFIDSGKILDLYLGMNDGTGHTVNAYAYEKDPVDPDVIWFKVYDPNFPRDKTGAMSMSPEGFRLKVTRRVKSVGNGYTFSYDYAPLLNNSYGATSNRAVNRSPMLLVLDEDWKDINPVKLTQDSTSMFTLTEDNNSFRHDPANFFASGEEFRYYLDDKYYDLLTKNSDSKEKKLIRKKINEKWGGSCYGIASTIGLLYDGEIGIFDLTDEDVLDYYELGSPCDDHKLRNMIHYYQLSQYLTAGDSSIAVSVTYNRSDLYKGLINITQEGDDYSTFLEKLVNHTKQSPALLEFSYLHDLLEVMAGDSFVGGHAILALECKENKDSYTIVLYDENQPGSKIDMTVAKDFQSFSFTDGNGKNMTQDTYVSMKFKDFETLYAAVNEGSSLKNSDTTIVFASDSDFTLKDENGGELSFSADGLSGDLVVNGLDIISRDDKGYRSDIVIKTDTCSSYIIDSRGESLDITVSSDEYFYSVSGRNIGIVTLHDGVVDVAGGEYDFDIAVSSDTEESSTNLVSYKGSGSGKVQVATEGEKIVIRSEEEISDLTAYNYDKDKTYEKLKTGKDGEYLLSAGTTVFMLKKYWWIGVIVLVTLATAVTVAVIVLKKKKKAV